MYTSQIFFFTLINVHKIQRISGLMGYGVMTESKGSWFKQHLVLGWAYEPHLIIRLPVNFKSRFDKMQ